ASPRLAHGDGPLDVLARSLHVPQAQGETTRGGIELGDLEPLEPQAAEVDARELFPEHAFAMTTELRPGDLHQRASARSRESVVLGARRRPDRLAELGLRIPQRPVRDQAPAVGVV